MTGERLIENNIFYYSPKELTTDAFLMWLFLEFQENEKLGRHASPFFYALGMADEPSSRVCDIRVRRQEKRADLIVRFKCDGVEKQALFENKTHTTFHKNQLETHIDNHSAVDHYIYLKLGYIYYAERKHAEGQEFRVVSSQILFDALSVFEQEHYLTKLYSQYLKDRYVDRIRYIETCLIENNEHGKFKDPQAQQYFMGLIHEKIADLPAVKFKAGTNSGGAPWTQLTIAERQRAYEDKTEYLFWRIDKRSNRYYLRLIQYSNIKKSFASTKRENLTSLRAIVATICSTHQLVPEQLSERGVKASEVVIFYFDKNRMSALLDALPDLSRKIAAAYGEL